MIGTALFGDLSNIKILFVVVVVLIVVDALSSYIDMLVSHDIAYRILTTLRDKAYDKVDELAPAAMEGEQSGNLVSVILEDIEVLEWFFAHTIPQVIVAFVILIATILFMGTFSWLLPAVAIPFAIAAMAFMAITGKKADEQGADVRSATGVLHAKIVDWRSGIEGYYLIPLADRVF